MFITLDKVCIKRRVLINNEELYIDDPGITTIVGKNGCGKTLLLRKVFFLLKKQGINVLFIEQGNEFIIENFSVAENISLKRSDSEDRIVRDFLSKYNFEHLIYHRSVDLSGGEKRIICFLRALYNLKTAEDVIIIDEPTNDLDIDNVKMLIDEMIMLSKSHAIIVSSHDDRIISISDAVLSIIGGHLI